MIGCTYCGAQNRADARFCNACGGLLPGAHPPTTPPAGPATPAAPASHHATGRLSPQSLLANRYLILKNVGQGGMAAVYLATDTRGNRTVAIKEMGQDSLSPEEQREALESFRFEAETLTRLRHPNLPRVYAQFSEDARHYLVMDYIDGETLEARLGAAGAQGQSKGLSEVEVLDWARQLCSVLTYLHSQRPPIIFRDLKPSNIMVTRGGQIKLIDFGIARVFAPGRARDTQVLGTPGYAPPEQYGKAQTDARADIYALGCTLYQLLGGYDPAQTPFALPPLHTRNPNVAPHVQLAIERATRLDREQRYQSVAAFEQDLLHPAGCYFRTGECARGRDELIALCLRQPAEAAEHLYSGRIEGWLRAWGETSAAGSAARAVQTNSDRTAGLRAFIASATPSPTTAAGAAASGTATPATSYGSYRPNRSRGAGAAATATRAAASAAATAATMVAVHPNSISLKLIEGQRGTAHFVVSGQASGSVQGQLTSLAPWLSLDRASFNARSTIVQLSVETSRIGGRGLHQSTVQITCGAQRVYLPVTVEVLPTVGVSRPSLNGSSGSSAVPGARSTAAPAARVRGAAGQPQQQAVGVSKYALPAVRQPRLLRLATSYAMAFGLALTGLLYVPQVLDRLRIGFPANWSVATLVLALLVATALSVPGALAGSARWALPGRVRAIAIGAVSGLIAALIVAGPYITSRNGELLMAAIVATGAALGSDPLLGRAIITIAAFVMRRIRLFVSLSMMALGCFLGGLLAASAAGWLAVPGIFLGGMLGLVLAASLNRLLARVTRVSSASRTYP